MATVFTIAKRAAEVAKAVLGSKPEGGHQRPVQLVTGSIAWRQFCWGHLGRDFQAMIDRGGPGRRPGAACCGCPSGCSAGGTGCGTGRSIGSGSERIAARLRREVKAALEAGLTCGCAKTAATCREFLKVEEGLWTFVRVEGVEPTNNDAERALRHAVIWRQISGGTDSDEGSRFVERMLTVVATCRQQERNVLDYLTSCFEAHLRGQKVPSLLPAK